MSQRGVCLGFALIFLAAACGGSSTATQSESPDEPGAGKPPGETPPESKGASGPSLAEQRQTFMTDCGKRVPAPDYCQCSWDLLVSMFSEQEMQAPDADPKKMHAYKQKLGATCGGKMPEEFARGEFLKSCTRQGKDFKAYCECGWTELRKTLSVADLMLDGGGPERFKTAMQSMTKACAGKLSDAVARDQFLDSCSQRNADAKEFCQCAWKQLRAAHSHTEIVAGLADVDGIKPKIKTACGKLHPNAKDAP